MPSGNTNETLYLKAWEGVQDECFPATAFSWYAVADLHEHELTHELELQHSDDLGPDLEHEIETAKFEHGRHTEDKTLGRNNKEPPERHQRCLLNLLAWVVLLLA